MRKTRPLRCLQAVWAFPTRTLVAPRRRLEIPAELARVGARRPLVVTDSGVAKQGFFSEFVDDLGRAGLHITTFAEVHPNPLDTDVSRGVATYRAAGADSVVCVGGGSAMDAGKCVAMCAESGLQLSECDYDVPYGEQAPPRDEGRLVPCVAVPTTAGTGAEMNSGSMYTDTAARVKRCAGHRDLPLISVLDPELTLSLPPSLTAWTGLDALVHALEAFFVVDYHPMCDSIALQAMRRIQRNLLPACADGSTDLAVRGEMLAASAMAAVAFQKGLGAVHGLSEPIGAVFDTHHGLTNAVLLPFVLRDLGGAIEERCAEIAHALSLAGTCSGAAAVLGWVEELSGLLGIPRRLGELKPEIASLDDAAIRDLAAKAERNPTGFANIVRFDAADYERVLRAAL